MTSKGGGGQTDDAGRAEMEESMTEHRKWSGEKERCDRIFGGRGGTV